jgi:hypothetical protein
MRMHIALGLPLALSGATTLAEPFGEESWRQPQPPFASTGIPTTSAATG